MCATGHFGEVDHRSLLAGVLLEDEFLLLNGDSIFDFNILDLAVRAERPPWLGRIALRRYRRPGMLSIKASWPKRSSPSVKRRGDS